MKRVLLPILLLATACSSERQTTPPTRDAGVTPRDAGPNVNRDAGPARDAGPGRDGGARDGGPDDSLAGTSLEGITIQWDEPLAMCNQWRENRSLDQERAVKVRIDIPPQTRALGRVRMAEARFSSGSLRRGPLAADQSALAGASSALDTWDLTNPSGDSTLDITLVHTLPGGATLQEQYRVMRTRGDSSPVVVDGESFDVAFWYTPAGETDGAFLEPCGGASELFGAVDAMVGRGAAGTIVVYRYLNTVDAFAGSFPVAPTAAFVKLSDRPWERFFAYGFWSQTYAAQHHNWNEESVIDFTKDLAWHEMAWEPYQDGGTPLARDMITEVRLVDVNNFAPGTIEVDIFDLTTGRTETRQYATETTWVPVDTPRATRQLAATCANPIGRTVQSGELEYAFHLLACPGGTGFTLDMMVVAAMQHRPEHTSRTLSGNAITPITRMGRPGFSVAIDGTTVEVTKNPSDEYFFLDVLEGRTNMLSSLAFELPIEEPSIDQHVLAFADTAGTVSARLERRWAGQGVGESSIFAPVSLEIEYGGTVYSASHWDQLDYDNTHHNWNDSIEARTGDFVLTWATEFNPPRDIVSIRRSDGTEVLPETVVEMQP